MNKKIISITFFLLIFLLFACSVIFSVININNLNILKGISINGIDVSNLSKDEAYNKIDKVIERKKNMLEFKLEENNIKKSSTFENLEIKYDIEKRNNRGIQYRKKWKYISKQQRNI